MYGRGTGDTVAFAKDRAADRAFHRLYHELAPTRSDLPSYEACLRLQALPCLPNELWHLIIDFVAKDSHASGEPGRHTLYACCLVCHAWLPRARMHIKPFRIQSRGDLNAAISRLSRTFVPSSHVHRLSIVSSQDDSWVSGFPVSFVNAGIRSVQSIYLHSIDYSCLAGHFLPYFALLHPRRLELDDVRRLSATQISRLVSTTLPNTLSVVQTNGASYIKPGRLTLSNPNLRRLDITSSIPSLDHLSNRWTISSPLQSLRVAIANQCDVVDGSRSSLPSWTMQEERVWERLAQVLSQMEQARGQQGVYFELDQDFEHRVVASEDSQRAFAGEPNAFDALFRLRCSTTV